MFQLYLGSSKVKNGILIYVELVEKNTTYSSSSNKLNIGLLDILLFVNTVYW